MLEVLISTLSLLVLALSIAVTFLFFIYGFNSLYLVRASRLYREPQPVGQFRKLKVAVHLPIYNEKYVIRRLVESCAAMVERYGKENARIVVLDDSDDETVEEVDRVVSAYKARDFQVEVLRRERRVGYKAGALQEGLIRTKEELIAIFDSDFLPPPDFLDRTVPYMVEDSRLGIVQTRWAHINRGYNSVTKAISIGIDGHFIVEQAARHAAQCFLNFNGSAGLIRTSALREAGGWQHDTLAEDLDASYRIQLKGYNVLYLRDLKSPAEVPPTMTSVKRQQGRWACGSIQTARKILPVLLSSKHETPKRKIEAFVHLTYYFVHPLIVASYLLATTAAIMNIDTISFKAPSITGRSLAENIRQLAEIIVGLTATSSMWVLFGSVIALSWAAAWIYYITALRAQGLSLVRNIPNLIVLGVVGYGISVSNTVEVFRGLFGREMGRFKRTPKYAVSSGSDRWRDRKYQVPLDRTLLLEMGFFVLGVISILRALQFSNYGIVPIIMLYAVSYLAVALATVLHRGKTSTD